VQLLYVVLIMSVTRIIDVYERCLMCVVYDLLCAFACVHREEANEYIEIGALNGLFVLGRSIGFIGEQKRSELLANANLT